MGATDPEMSTPLVVEANAAVSVISSDGNPSLPQRYNPKRMLVAATPVPTRAIIDEISIAVARRKGTTYNRFATRVTAVLEALFTVMC
jgi:hypothetical protein